VSRVLIVGGGPAGLTAARALRQKGVDEVVVIEREREAGGIPRHSDHSGYGLRDLHRLMRGPKYAQTLVAKTRDCGAQILTSSMVTGWEDSNTLQVTSPNGRLLLSGDAIVLATGARERPRAARMIPGDRPEGVLTTGQLQNLVHLRHREVGKRAVIVGAELVSWSAVLTLREAGCKTVAMLSGYAKAESYAALVIPARTALGIPIQTRTRIVRIVGKSRVEAVEIEHLETGKRKTLECDTVVLTGDWIPDYELAQLGELDLDDGSRGPTVDTALRTSRPGVFAAGNLVHPVDTADVAALDGVHVAQQIKRWLDNPSPLAPAARIIAEAPFTWVSPGIVRTGDPSPARNRVLLWSSQYHFAPRVIVRQGGSVLSSRTLPWPISPGRVFRLPWSMLAPACGTNDITISVA